MPSLAWIQSRREVIRCIKYDDGTMFLIRKLNNGHVYMATYTWWFDCQRRIWCCETWPGLHPTYASLDPDNTTMSEFRSEAKLRDHLFSSFGGYTNEFEIPEWVLEDVTP